MKRQFFLGAALWAAMAIFAQDYAEVDHLSVDGGSGIATPVAAGTVVATGMNGLEVKVACDDSYMTVVTGTDDYEAYVFNGTYLDGMTGITGNSNPRSANGTALTYFANYNNAVPASGCAYTFTVPGDDPNQLAGYFYACGKLSSNKQYWVTEGSHAVGYEIDMVISGNAEHFVVAGDSNDRNRLTADLICAQFTNLPPSIQAAGGWTDTPSLDQMRGYERSDWAGIGSSIKGMGYIKFPVYEGQTYYFGASGSKFNFSAFYLSPSDEVVTVSLKDEDGLVDDLRLSFYIPVGPLLEVPDYAEADYQSVDGGSGIATPVAAGTVVATGMNGLEVKVVCDDDYKTRATDMDGYDTFVFNSTELAGGIGIEGTKSPVTAEGYPPTYFACYDNAIPISGCAYSFTVPGVAALGRLVGYFYACGQFSAERRQYWVTEGNAAVGYEVNVLLDGSVHRFEVAGDPDNFNRLSPAAINEQFTDLPSSVQEMGGWLSTPSLCQMLGMDSWPMLGIGYIKFPVYEGHIYCFGATGGSFPFSAFYLSSGNERVTVLLRDDDGELDDLLLSGEEPTSISSHDAMEVVQEEYYTVSGIRVSALVPGLNLVRQVFSDGSVRTVKVVR